jgi:hypothetical protein
MIVLKCARCGKEVESEYHKDFILCDTCYDLVYQEKLNKRFYKLLNVLLEHERVAPAINVGA